MVPYQMEEVEKESGMISFQRISSTIALLIELHVSFADPCVQSEGEKFVHSSEGLKVN